MAAETKRTSKAHIACSILIAGWVAMLFYALDRTYSALTTPGYDPLAIVASLRIDYFWRMAVGGFLGVSAGMIHFVIMPPGSSDKRYPWLAKAGIPVVLIATILGIVFP